MAVTNGNHTLGRAIGFGLERLERNLHTAQPGIVVSYDAASQAADVQPAVNLMLPDAEEEADVSERLPVCPHVPVMWPRGRGFSCVGTLSPGDSVLLVFCERDFSQWYETNSVSDPGFAELHALNGAVAIPGLTPPSNPISVPSDAAALASKLDFPISKIMGVTPSPSTEPGLVALQTALTVAVWTLPGFTTGSSVLKLGS